MQDKDCCFTNGNQWFRYRAAAVIIEDENFFYGTGSLSGYECHEIAFYYLMKKKGSRELKGNSDTTTSMGTFKENLYWLPIRGLKEYKAFPAFFAEELLQVSDKVRHIITDER